MMSRYEWWWLTASALLPHSQPGHSHAELSDCMHVAGSVIGHVGISFNLPLHHGMPCRTIPDV
jgi:hypothetical protein